MWFESSTGVRHPCFAEGPEGVEARDELAAGTYMSDKGDTTPKPFRRFMELCERKEGCKEENYGGNNV